MAKRAKAASLPSQMLSTDASVDCSSASAASISRYRIDDQAPEELPVCQTGRANRVRDCDCRDAGHLSYTRWRATKNRIAISRRARDRTRTLLTAHRCEHRVEPDGVVLSARRESREGRSIVHASSPIAAARRSTSTRSRFHLATGFPRPCAARFFKHGYQSWSASHPVAVGIHTHRRDQRSRIARVNHQSEVVRPQDAPEARPRSSSRLWRANRRRERFLAGFIGAAHQLTTITVRTPNHVMARALLDDVVLHRARTARSSRSAHLAFERKSRADGGALRRDAR